MLESIIEPIEKGIDKLKFKVKKQFNLFDPIFIYPYRGYGYNGKIILQGRVLEKERVVHGDNKEDSLLHNLHRFYKRYESDEIPHVELEFKYHNKTYTAKTNDEGLYYLEIPYNPEEDHPFWDKVEIKIINSPVDLYNEKVTATGEIMIPDSKSAFGVISDVDDTIIESNATTLWLKLKTLVFNTAGSRVAFPGIAEYYKALVKQKSNRYKNPIWFISGSSWNLYDLMDNFCKQKGIPRGPFLLRQLDVNAKKFIKGETTPYKLEHIKPLMKLTDPLPFILIGDSGQDDAHIYQQVVKEFPGRIMAIYIRDLNGEAPNADIEEIIKDLKKEKIDMILASDSADAAKHSLEKGWITETEFNRIKKDTEKVKKEEQTK